MKPLLPFLAAIASVGLGGFSPSALAGPALVSTVFEANHAPGTEPSPVASLRAGGGRHWEGTAVVGDGLIHGGEDKNSYAFVPVEVPVGAKKLVVEMSIVSRSGGQFAFGFLNGSEALEKGGAESGNHGGVIWVNHMGPGFKLHAGRYANGSAPDQASMRKWADGVELDIRFEAAVVDEAGYRCSVSVRGEEVVAGDLLPDVIPEFRHFFIQFRGGEETVSGVSVRKVTVGAE